MLGRTFVEHLKNIQSVLQRIRESDFSLKSSKCYFFQHRVQYLGHIISREGVATDQSKTEKVATWPTPTSILEVRQFLGFASYYRKFIRNFAHMAQPLHKLTERSMPFVWTDVCQNAFDELRRCLTSTFILTYHDFSSQFILDTDASNTGIGAVLSQVNSDGYEQVVAYGSRLLTKSERQYCVTHRELLAVVTFTHQYSAYLTGKRFLFTYRSWFTDLAVQLQGA